MRTVNGDFVVKPKPAPHKFDGPFEPIPSISMLIQCGHFSSLVLLEQFTLFAGADLFRADLFFLAGGHEFMGAGRRYAPNARIFVPLSA